LLRHKICRLVAKTLATLRSRGSLVVQYAILLVMSELRMNWIITRYRGVFAKFDVAA